MDHRERMKQTVEKERSPPDKARMSLKAALFPSPGWTLKEVTKKQNAEKSQINFFTEVVGYRFKKDEFIVKMKMSNKISQWLGNDIYSI